MLYLSQEIEQVIPWLKIGLDVDETKFDHSGQDYWGFRQWHKRNYGKGFEMEDFTVYDYGWVLDLGDFDHRFRMREFQRSGDFVALMPVPGIVEAVDKLKRMGEFKLEELFSVSSRPGFLREVTCFRLNAVFGSGTFSDLLLTANSHDKAAGVTKGKVCKDLGIHVLIEDFGPYAQEVAQNGFTQVLLRDMPYNKSVSHPRITRYIHPSEIPGKIVQIIKG